MSLAIQSQPMPLKSDMDGVVRVGKTRVPLDSVISSFNSGATAEEIAYRFPSLELADIYAVISYYLKNREEVESYLVRRQNIKDRVQEQNRLRFGSDITRERLEARRTEEKNDPFCG